MNVKYLCLGALCLKEGSGYDIKKLFESAFTHFQGASYGSIYPALNQLKQEALIELQLEPGKQLEPGRKPEPGKQHPDRKVYGVTEDGRKAFIDHLCQMRPDEQIRSDFMVLMFFAHLLPTDRLIAILDEVEDNYRQELDYLQSIENREGHTAGIDFTIGAGIAAIGASLHYLQQRRSWLLANHHQPPSSRCNDFAPSHGASR